MIELLQYWRLPRGRMRARLIGAAVSMLLAATPAPAQSVHVRATGGVFIVNVVLNEKVAVSGTIDTGASDFVLLCDHAAQALDLLKGRKVDLQTAGGPQVGYEVVIRSVRLGVIELKDVHALVMPQRGPCRALVGFSVLKRLANVNITGDSMRLVARARSTKR